MSDLTDQCPVCGLRVSTDFLEVHVNLCLDQEQDGSPTFVSSSSAYVSAASRPDSQVESVAESRSSAASQEYFTDFRPVPNNSGAQTSPPRRIARSQTARYTASSAQASLPASGRSVATRTLETPALLTDLKRVLLHVRIAEVDIPALEMGSNLCVEFNVGSTSRSISFSPDQNLSERCACMSMLIPEYCGDEHCNLIICEDIKSANLDDDTGASDDSSREKWQAAFALRDALLPYQLNELMSLSDADSFIAIYQPVLASKYFDLERRVRQVTEDKATYSKQARGDEQQPSHSFTQCSLSDSAGIRLPAARDSVSLPETVQRREFSAATERFQSPGGMLKRIVLPIEKKLGCVVLEVAVLPWPTTDDQRRSAGYGFDSSMLFYPSAPRGHRSWASSLVSHPLHEFGSSEISTARRVPTVPVPVAKTQESVGEDSVSVLQWSAMSGSCLKNMNVLMRWGFPLMPSITNKTCQVDPLLLNALWKPSFRPDTASIGSFGSSINLATTDKNARGWFHYFVLGCSRQAPPSETFNWLKELLFQHPELVMSRDSNSRTPLHYLAMFEVRPSSSYLFEQIFKKMDPLSMFQCLFALARVRDLIGRSALHYAAERGDLELVKCLVEHCPRVEVDKFGDSPLMLAVRNAKFDVCQILFRADASNHKILPDAVSSLLQRIGIGHRRKLFESDGARTAADVVENDIWTNFKSLGLDAERGGPSVNQLLCLSSEVADKVALMWGKNVFTALSTSLDVSCTVIHELCNRDSDIAIWRALFETLPLASWAILLSLTDSLGQTPIQYLMKRSISGSAFAGTLLQYVITPLMLCLFQDCKLEQTFHSVSTQQQSTSAPSVAEPWALDDEYCFEYQPLDLSSDGAATSQVAADAIEVTIQNVVEILPSGPQVIDRATLARMRQADIDAVAEVLSASALHLPLNARACAHSLLQSKRWDAERLLLQFSDDPSTVLTEAGLSLQPDVNADEFHACQICFESVAMSECMTACGHHWFDRTCWKGHLKAKLDNGVPSAFARCPAVQCRAFITPDIWSAVLEDDSVSMNLYRKYSVDSYASFHKSSMRWCPHPDCDRAFVSAGTQQSMGIKCVCGTELCGICFNAAHAPSSCTQLAQWDDEKLARASDDLKAIMRECRACPKCRVVIYRNEGCNHMTCAQCSHQFCWKCKGPWSDHGSNTGGFYECVLFDPIKHAEVNVLSRSGGADASTMRFVQFLHRVDLHAECETVARAQLSAGAVESLTRPALLELISSRMFLKNASIVLYFADQPHDMNQSLFALLMQLESHVELLTEAVEKHAERRIHESVRRMMELCEARRLEFLQALSTFGLSK